MSDRRKRITQVPAHLRDDETWYLVEYEEDRVLRVLHEDEVSHILEDVDEQESFQVGDLINALWLPTGQPYEAKIIQISDNKSELLKERMKIEKQRKMADKSEQAKKDNKTAGGRKRKNTSSKISKDSKAEERQAKQKKKEELQHRQKMLIEARKSQANERWNLLNAISSNRGSIHHSPSHSTTQITAADSHIHQSLLAPSATQNSTADSPIHQSPLACSTPQELQTGRAPQQLTAFSTMNQSTIQHTPIQHTPIQHTPIQHTPIQPTVQRTQSTSNNTPKPPTTGRSLHFSRAVELSEGESSDGSEFEGDGLSSERIQNSCCKEFVKEVQVLRERLKKTHKRLQIALKAKTFGEIVQNRPAAGVLDPQLAQEFRMKELMEGSSVFWYSHQRAYCSAFTRWEKYLAVLIDMFFSKDELACSSALGKGQKGTEKRQGLNPVIVQAIIGKVCSKFTNEKGCTPSAVTQKINVKCQEAKRGPRIRVNKKQTLAPVINGLSSDEESYN